MAEFRKAILLAGLICVAASDRAAGSAVPKWSARQLANFADVDRDRSGDQRHRWA